MIKKKNLKKKILCWRMQLCYFYREHVSNTSINCIYSKKKYLALISYDRCILFLNIEWEKLNKIDIKWVFLPKAYWIKNDENINFLKEIL